MKIIPFDRISNDLFAEIGQCDCSQWPDTPSLAFCKKRIKVTGYADTYFFDTVSREPTVYKCPVCGVEIKYQWTRAGVVVWDSINSKGEEQ